MEDTRFKASPVDFFLHLLVVVTLYVSVYSFTSLLFEFVDFVLPDAVRSYVNHSGIRWSIASLAVSFPLFLYFSNTIRKSLKAEPEKRDARSRRWLLAFTIFLAGTIFIGNLTWLVYQFLEGALTSSVLTKSFIVFAVTAVVFTHYRRALRSDVVPLGAGVRKAFTVGVTSAVTLAVVAGLWVTGSPWEKRKLAFDDRRISDLHSIERTVRDYWYVEKKLPPTLESIKEQQGFYLENLVDPEDKSLYEYRVAGEKKFALCATFKTSSAETKKRYGREFYLDKGWEHGSGKYCFERTVNEGRR